MEKFEYGKKQRKMMMEIVNNMINFNEKNEVCEGCVRCKLFGKKCRYYWHGKVECYSKCYSEKEMMELDTLRSGSI